MKYMAKRGILIFVIITALVLSLASVAFAAQPLYIFYENQNGEIVQANLFGYEAGDTVRVVVTTDDGQQTVDLEVEEIQ